MALANVQLTNTFDEWRTRTNELIVQGESSIIMSNAAFTQANVANIRAIAAFTKANTTTFTSNLAIVVAENNNAAFRITQTGTAAALLVQDSTTDLSPFIIDASGNVGIGLTSPTSSLHVDGTANITTSLMLAGTDMIIRLINTGTGANNYSANVGRAANTYSDSRDIVVGTGANAYTDLRAVTIGIGANNYSNSRGVTVGTGANAYSAVVGAAANTNAANATYLSTGTVPAARLSGSYTSITGVGTLTAGTWQATSIAVAYGGTGATDAATARTNLGAAGTSDFNRFISGQKIGTGAGYAEISIDGSAGETRAVAFRSGTTTPRWLMGAGNQAETGSNAGSPFFINRYGDNGAYIDTPFYIFRDTGITSINRLSLTTDLEVAHGGTGASDPGQARTNLGIGTNATRNLTVSTAAPSGGADGDVWYRI